MQSSSLAVACLRVSLPDAVLPLRLVHCESVNILAIVIIFSFITSLSAVSYKFFVFVLTLLKMSMMMMMMLHCSFSA